MEGYLKKWTNYVTRWKKRYFELNNGVLQYSKSKIGKRKGTVYISTTEISTHKNKCRIVLNTGVSTIHLKASSVKEATEWMVALRSCKDAMHEIAFDKELQKQRTESVPICMESMNYTRKLWNVHKMMEEKYFALPNAVREQAQEFMEFATEFKNLAMDTLNLLEEEKGEKNAVSDDEFEDAKSHATELFEEVKFQELQIAYRDKLPIIRNPGMKFNIWKILKDTIGKDLSKIAVPVYFNEPLSFLQRFTEDMTYNHILLQAAESDDQYMRLALVACFAVSSYTHTSCRLMKPFNPILGETFEFEKDGFRAISEQVSHHPPISAIHCTHPQYTFSASTSLQTNFKGTYLKLRPRGKCNVQIHNYSDHFVFEKPFTNVNNIIIGKINLDHHGKIEIKNLTTGDMATVILKKKGWFNKEIHQVSGVVCNSSGMCKYTIEGHWDEKLIIKNEVTGEETTGYSAMPALAGYEFSYFFTEFAMQLNLPPDLFMNLAPTDSRYRPDQRALENGQLEIAANEKERLEEKQRNARKVREENNEEYKPIWFSQGSDSQWTYKGGYWQAKDYSNFSRSPEIY